MREEGPTTERVADLLAERLFRGTPEYVEHYIGMRREEIGKALGARVGRQLGCGAYGCVFRLGRDVLKVTADELEARYWQWLGEQRRRHPEELRGVPEVHRVSWLQTTDGVQLGMIVREDLADAPERVESEIDGALMDYAVYAQDFYADVDYDVVMSRMRHAAEEISDHPAGAALGRALWWLARHGHPPTDLHPANIGMRDGELVMRDPGGVPPVSSEQIHERVVANPCCDMLTANGEQYFVWTVARRGHKPLEGWGPYTNLASVKIHSRIKAQKGKHDVTVTTHPKRAGFRLIRRYAQGTGETLVRG